METWSLTQQESVINYLLRLHADSNFMAFFETL
ncbi:hypothetical protein DESC_900002 [Desulfosarcina cetonica]|nr:hypothetical protein DESC_900002 [Desulfosarcina cetonica]